VSEATLMLLEDEEAAGRLLMLHVNGKAYTWKPPGFRKSLVPVADASGGAGASPLRGQTSGLSAATWPAWLRVPGDCQDLCGRHVLIQYITLFYRAARVRLWSRPDGRRRRAPRSPCLAASLGARLQPRGMQPVVTGVWGPAVDASHCPAAGADSPDAGRERAALAAWASSAIPTEGRKLQARRASWRLPPRNGAPGRYCHFYFYKRHA